MPRKMNETRRFDPPYEINGKGTPVSGKRVVMPLKLMIICKLKNAKIPDARSLPYRSGACDATL